MNPFAIFLYLFAIFFTPITAADGGFCTKCQVMREYHKNNPSKYKYYDDYIKDLEEKGADTASPSIEDLPPDVQFIMEQETEKVDPNA